MAYTIRYIGATWCASCKVIQPKIEELCKKFSLELDVYDIEELDETEAETITKVPTVQVIFNSKIVHSWDKNQVKSFEEWCADRIKLETTDF